MPAKPLIQSPQMGLWMRVELVSSNIYPSLGVVPRAPLTVGNVPDCSKGRLGRIVMVPETEVALVDRLIQRRGTPQLSRIITIAPEHGAQTPAPVQSGKGSACEQRRLCFV